MIDLHVHTFFSDGELCAAELVGRAEVAGYQVIGLADHADPANLDFVVTRALRFAQVVNPYAKVRILPGVELTYLPLPLIAPLVQAARGLGAAFVIVHGETPLEPTPRGTNRAAIAAGADILAHPGLLSLEEALAAKEARVLLEISGREKHFPANRHILSLARQHDLPLVLSSDAHAPEHLLGPERLALVRRECGISDEEFARMQANGAQFGRGG